MTTLSQATIGHPHDRSAQEVAAFLLQSECLSDWQIGFLAAALEETAEYTPVTSDAWCMNELVQMNSQHFHSILGVAYALTGVSFNCSWQGIRGSRFFTLLEVQRHVLMARGKFDALIEAHGWGSNAHRRALGVFTASCANPPSSTFQGGSHG